MEFAFAKPAPRRLVHLVSLMTGGLAAMGLAGCGHERAGPQVAGFTLVDASQRHPILVSQQPTTMSLRVPRGSGGLAPRQRAQVVEFASRYRASDAGDSRLVIAAPSGSPNEVAALSSVHEIHDILVDSGFSPSAIIVEAYTEERDPHPPVRLSYLRYVAEAPECGSWPANLAREPQNLPYENLGCATQRNLAVMVANPGDLLGPRGETARASERRDVVWEKYVRGQSTTAAKTSDERVSTQASQ